MKFHFVDESAPLFPEERLVPIYREAGEKLYTLTGEDMPALDAVYGLQFDDDLDGEDIPEIENRFEDWFSAVPWGLRVADSFGHTALVDRILKHARTHVALESFLVLGFLTFAFGTEYREVKEAGYRLNPISPTLEALLHDVLYSRLAATIRPREWETMSYVASRLAMNLPFSPYGQTYLTLEEGIDFINAVERRQLFNPVPKSCLGWVGDILSKRARIEHYWSVKDHLDEYIAQIPPIRFRMQEPKVVNRSAVVILPRPEFLAWAKEQGAPVERQNASMTRGSTIILVSALPYPQNMFASLEEFKVQLLEQELAQWDLKPEAWQGLLSAEQFDAWFTLEFHNVVVDMGVSPYGEAVDEPE